METKIRGLPDAYFHKILYGIVFLIHKHNQYLTGIQIAFGTQIGSGLTFSHFSCIVINSGAIIGKNCTIFQGVTIGSIRGIKGGVPTIGDNVIIFAGAKIIGNVKIGNNTVIGANAVVTHNIPDNSVAVGIPAKVISNNSKNIVKYYI
ncbi:serine acetyltransferase [Bacteroides eggerthii]|uniref:Serine acetyltransferase n=1 Tax=Bacteroides eggerthii TaxID=28111 RepID=A0A414M5E9_9BACE|nr:serine acetyltransferase [Bacteroides eggerthii]RHF04680.1 serine acetyltransferase [Bacteroides eggerthii]